MSPTFRTTLFGAVGTLAAVLAVLHPVRYVVTSRADVASLRVDVSHNPDASG